MPQIFFSHKIELPRPGHEINGKPEEVTSQKLIESHSGKLRSFHNSIVFRYRKEYDYDEWNILFAIIQAIYIEFFYISQFIRTFIYKKDFRECLVEARIWYAFPILKTEFYRYVEGYVIINDEVKNGSSKPKINIICRTSLNEMVR